MHLPTSRRRSGALPLGFTLALVALLLTSVPAAAFDRASDSESGRVTARQQRTDGIRCAWAPGFHLLGFNGPVFASTSFDEGRGEALYLGGDFTMVEDQRVGRVARWDGRAWTTLGIGFDAEVYALTVFDDGRGPALYAGGAFTSSGRTRVDHLARWDGSSWQSVGLGLDGRVRTLVVHDDGRGPALYAGGWFTRAGGRPAPGIARWDGRRWTPLGELDGSVSVLAVYDAGDGPELYVGGVLRLVPSGSLPRDYGLLRWDGQAWRALGLGIDEEVASLVVYDDGAGPALFAGGTFTNATGQGIDYVAKWDGSAWHHLPAQRRFQGVPFALAVYDDGRGPELYAGGSLVFLGGGGFAGVARWDGSTWEPLAAGVDSSVHTLIAHDDGAGPRLWVGGLFHRAGFSAASALASWNGQVWSAPRGPAAATRQGLDGSVLALHVLDDGTGPALYAGGYFTHAGRTDARHIARWDGQAWSALGFGLNEVPYALVSYDDGKGPRLIAGGQFTDADNRKVGYVAAWDGTSWSALAGGLNAPVFSLVVHDDGRGPALYAGGLFGLAINSDGSFVGTNRIARWDGHEWSPVDAELAQGFWQQVTDLVVYDDGTGAALYAFGWFIGVDGPGPLRIGKWEGDAWSFLDLEPLAGDPIEMQVLDGVPGSVGDGPALYVTVLDRNTFYRTIARWDGTAWTTLEGRLASEVEALMVYDDGRGPALLAAGWQSVGGRKVGGFHYWTESGWGELHRGLNGAPLAVTVFDDGTGPALYTGGAFSAAGGSFSSNLGKYVCQAP